MIRIISGKYRSRQINAPDGLKTRPTTARVRESVFSALCNAYGGGSGLDGAHVWDAFAGSGALGLEALSRGAKSCVFTDINYKAIKCIKDNIETLRVDNNSAQVWKQSALSENTCRRVVNIIIPDIVFLDAPYAMKPADLYKIVNNLSKFYSETNGTDPQCSRQISGLDAKSPKQLLIYYEHNQSIAGTPWENLDLVFLKNAGDIKAEIYSL